MREAVIVSYARTGLAKSGRGGFNITPPMSMAAHAIKHAVERAGVDKDYVEDCYLGNCAHGASNIGRQAALLAGMPKSTAGVSVNRFCSSGLQTIAMAANSIRSDGADCIVAGGVETTWEGLSKLEPVQGPGKYITAGNASQLSDGAAAVVLMEAKDAEKRGLEPLGRFVAWAAAGCEPDEMGIGPVFAVPKLLKRHGLKVDDIDIWELNEAFASQCLYSRDQLGIDPDKYNVNGGSIAIGHPFGMTGARLTGPILHEGRRRKAKWGVVTIFIGGRPRGAGLFEIYSSASAPF